MRRHSSFICALSLRKILTDLLEIFFDLIISLPVPTGAIRDGIEILLIIFSYVFLDNFLSVVDDLEVPWLLGDM
jgi:hypothetical protein